MEGHDLLPAREARGWVFDPVEVAALKAKRMVASTGSPLSEGRLAVRVFYLFDDGSELREIVQELEVPPGVVRDLWHEWLVDLGEGEMIRNKTATDERKRRAEEKELA